MLETFPRIFTSAAGRTTEIVLLAEASGAHRSEVSYFLLQLLDSSFDLCWIHADGVF
jgi:hypothetical protein